MTRWNDEKGFGFVTPRSGGKKVFVHITAFSNRKRRPELNELVTYALSADKDGRPCAVRATLPGDRLPKKTKRKKASLSPVGAALFLVIVGVSVLTAKIPIFIFALYMVASLLTFIMYAVDKSAAQKGARRTQESTLHLLSIAGGVARSTRRATKAAPQVQETIFSPSFLANDFAELRCLRLAVHANRRNRPAVFD